MENVNLVLSDSQGSSPTITFIHGTSPKQLDAIDDRPKPTSHSGTISTPAIILLHPNKHFDTTKTVVKLDRKDRIISAESAPGEYMNHRVSGSIDLNPDLDKLKINHAYAFRRDDFYRFLKTESRFFTDKASHAKLVAAVKDFQATAAIDFKNTTADRGNKDDKFKKEVKAPDMPQSILVEIAVFKGENKVKMVLDVQFDTVDNNVAFWFESSELNEAIEDETERRLKDELKLITDAGFKVIEK